SQPRPSSAVQGRQYHYRVPHQIRARPARRGGARRQARPSGPRAQSDPRDGRGIAVSPRLVRVVAVVNTVAFAVPGDPAPPPGGYTYDRRIIAELPDLGWRVDVLNIGEGFPRPTRETRASAAVRLAAVPEGRPIVIDGLAFGVLPDEAEALRQRHALVALVHHPLALETGLSQGASEALRQSERAALATTRHVIASSPTTARPP